MKMDTQRIFAGILAAALIVHCGCGRQASTKDLPIVSVKDDDAEMNKAISDARASVGEFIIKLKSPSADESDFSVKVPISDGNETEHFWLGNLTYSNGIFFGTINNDPETVKTVSLGQKYSVKETDISDWLYLKGKKMIGNRTLKALFPHMSPKEVEALKKQFEMD